MTRIRITGVVAFVLIAGWATAALGFQPFFTYQGLLRRDGNPVNGTCDFQFRLYGQGSGGSPIGLMNASNLAVADGVFTMQLNFSQSAFSGADRYLEIDVRCPTATGAYTTLTPRQLIAAAPYSIHAAEAGDLSCSGCIDGNQIPGLGITGDKLANGAVTSASIAGGAVVTNALANGAVTADKIGASAVQPYHLSFTPGTVTALTAGAGLTGGTISTSGTVAVDFGTSAGTVAAGDHRHDQDYWRLGGNSGFGGDAVLGTTSDAALDVRVNGGRALRLIPGTSPGVVGGWTGNTVLAGALGAAIAGGGTPDDGAGTAKANRVADDYGAVSGGAGNLAGSDNGNRTDAQYATVGGGGDNTASALGAVVTGGGGNTASGVHAAVGGGALNAAAGVQATVPGGAGNAANGAGSFAAGRLAWAIHDGAFLWGDGTTLAISQGANTFNALASGGFHFYFGTTGNNCKLTSTAGWQCSGASDRNAKTGFTDVDSREILERVASLRIERWSYAEEAPAVQHIGPMAQDFHAAFGIGQNDTSIATVDADGVALAAIQALHARLQAQARELEELRATNASLTERVRALEASAIGGTDGWKTRPAASTAMR